MNTRRACALLLSGLLGAAQFLRAAEPIPGSTNVPPRVLREFRGAWVASVNNINWPSKPGLTTEQQKKELLTLLDNAADLKLNAILLQIRPACDALYASKLEPWSEFLTGEMGRAPTPFYDPLAFAVEEAHRRGLELHAWLNPYRARLLPRKNPAAAGHVSRARPSLVRKYGQQLWLDPGEKAVQDHTYNVILDVVGRYDIDGIHLDDYFYPYPEKDGRGKLIDFPDDPSWRTYRAAGGKLERDDWRRRNVNQLIQRLQAGIQRRKPWVRFGISPFGIWRPGFPKEVTGLDAYGHLYADSRLWLREGWIDYCAPQLYWRINSPGQSYPALLKWWLAENPKERHVWPGSSFTQVGRGWSPDEMVNQLDLARSLNQSPGHLLWDLNIILRNESGVRDALAQRVYNEPALSPAFPWLDSKPPAQPIVALRPSGPSHEATIQWGLGESAPPRLWILQTRSGTVWRTEIIPGRFNARTFTGDDIPDLIALAAIDRCANASPATLLSIPKNPEPQPPHPSLRPRAD